MDPSRDAAPPDDADAADAADAAEAGASARAELAAGVRAAAPLLLGILPFALVAGYAAVDAGFSPLQAVGFSLLVFAGSSQLAAIELVGRGAPLAVVVGTAVVINLRMLMYSASIAPYLRHLSTRRKAALSYLLTDQAYALTIPRLAGREDDAGDGADADRAASGTTSGAGDADDPRTDAADTATQAGPSLPLATGGDLWFYLGVGAAVWVVWQAGTVAGVLVGTGVPPAWGLEFTAPLVFLALLVHAVDGRPAAVAAAVGAAVAVAGDGLPLNLGLLVAALAGVLAGVLADARGWWS